MTRGRSVGAPAAWPSEPRGGLRPLFVLLVRAVLVVLAVVPLVLLLTRSGPGGLAQGTPASPGDGLGGMGTGVLDSPTNPDPGGALPVGGPAPGAAVAPGGGPVIGPGGGTGGGGVVAPAPGVVPPPGPSPERTSRPPQPAPLHAVYKTSSSGMTGYEVQVTITNPGGLPVSGWTVALTFPAAELVTGAKGAAHTQPPTGTVTFTPSGDATVPAHGTVSFTVSVAAVGLGPVGGPPTGCTIDGRAC